ncbi:MAG: hypothetical protein RIM99_12775 [Cyclobacteriaceae bacterium]
MESPIERLIEKYWNGETTLDEEKKVKQYFKTNPALSLESEYFRFLKKKQSIKFDQKVKKNSKRTWLSAAATVTIGLITALLVLQEAKDPYAIDDPQKALEEAKKALMMIGSGLNDGQSYAMELNKINKAKEELKEEDSEAL